jgi:arsenate reductase
MASQGATAVWTGSGLVLVTLAAGAAPRSRARPSATAIPGRATPAPLVGTTRAGCIPFSATVQVEDVPEPKEQDMEIWINPACSKCRSALSLLDEEGAQYTVRRYLEEPPTAQEIEEVLGRLQLEPWDIARVGEPVAAELGLASWTREETDRARWIEALAAHPILIQRPIITAADGTAVVGRSPESVRSVLP